MLNTKPTIGVDFASKSITYKGVSIYGHIWDTAGQEKFQAVSSSLYRGALGAIIVYDITNRNSFENVTKWLGQLEKFGEQNCIKIIIGNKCDMNHLRQVTVDEGKDFAEKHGMAFMETSALNATNIELAFSTILQNIYLNKPNNNIYHPPGASGTGGIMPPPGVVLPPTTDPSPPPQHGFCQC